MRDLGVEGAIRVAGGVGALARKIGISQPSISNWSRVPAERVLAIEAATGVARATLRPDLYAAGSPQLDDADAARAEEYALLARRLEQSAPKPSRASISSSSSAPVAASCCPMARII